MTRFASKQQQTEIVYVAMGCTWAVFFTLGVRALVARKKLSSHDWRLFGLAARKNEEWLGLGLAIVGVPVLVFGTFTMSGVQQDWSALGGILMFIAWYLIWRGAYMICLDNETLHYTSLFGGYRQVKIEEISASRSIVAIHPTRPTVRLEIYQPNQQGPIVINRAIFKPRLIEILVNRLGATLRDDELKV